MKRVALAATLMMLAACSVTIPITKPTPSGPSFSDASAKPATLRVIDGREGDEKNFSPKLEALNRAQVILTGVDSPVGFLADNLDKEFAARGYPVKVTTDPAGPADLELTVTRYRITARRVNAFTPWESIHEFRGVLKSGAREQVIKSFYFAGKVPVVSMSEIVAPCYDVPQSFMAKEIASKINHARLGFRSQDEVVGALLGKITPKVAEKDGGCPDLIALGGTNNPKAIEPLRRFAMGTDEGSRACAISALSMIGSEAELDFLSERYASLGGVDKFMAVKAVGDVGGDKGLELVKKAAANPLYGKEAGFKYVVDLYSTR
jgi:hypothetical protein